MLKNYVLDSQFGCFLCSKNNDGKLYKNKMIEMFCERFKVKMIEGRKYDERVVIDGNGKLYVVIPRAKNNMRWVEYYKLRKNVRLD